MKCPVCSNSELTMAERSGIEIDYCPRCRGVWLDRGELDKIIERAAGEQPPAPRPAAPQHMPPPPPPQYAQQHPHHPHMKPDDSHFGYPYQKRRKSWLSELFD